MTSHRSRGGRKVSSIVFRSQEALIVPLTVDGVIKHEVTIKAAMKTEGRGSMRGKKKGEILYALLMHTIGSLSVLKYTHLDAYSVMAISASPPSHGLPFTFAHQNMKIIAVLLWLSLRLIADALDVSGKIDAGSHGSYPVQKFASSKVKAPYVNFVQHTPACNDGLQYFITPRGWKNKNPGPMILDDAGNLLWSHHFANKFGGQAYDLRVQKYKGEDYLTFWLGDDRIRGHGAGHYYMLNSSYDIVHTVGAASGRFADLHEFTITPEGTALLIVFEPIQADVRPVGRKFSDLWNQAAWDCLFQEIDIESGQLIFEWRASTHLNMTLSYQRVETPDMGTREKPFDWIHLNSVDKDELGNYLISARNLHALLYIDGKTQEIVWVLGGSGNYFQDVSDGHVLNMAWQHDARFTSPDAFPETYTRPENRDGHETRLITLFDNAALDWDYSFGMQYSRALLLEVTYPTATLQSKLDKDPQPPTRDSVPSLSAVDNEKVGQINGTNSAYSVRIIQDYVNPQHVRSSTQGSAQVISQGKGVDSHIFVGYGINAVLTDFYANGTVACDVHFGARTSWETGDIQSYRAYKSSWVGKPTTPPALTVRHDKAYISWNGATEVKEWILQASPGDDEDWVEISITVKDGFETVITLLEVGHDFSGERIRVVAVDDQGEACANGVSNVAWPSRFASGLTSHMHVGSMSILYLAVVVVGSGTALLLLYRRRRFRVKVATRDYHLD